MKVLVTGGTSGLGLAMAEALATAGATVALTGRSGERANQVAAGLPNAIGIELDQRDESSVATAVDEAWERRAGFVPYGPSRAGSESLSRIMAADLQDTNITVNLLLPGGPTVTGMLPPEAERPEFLQPEVMGPPIVWLASEQAAGVHDERIVAAEFERWLRARPSATAQ